MGFCSPFSWLITAMKRLDYREQKSGCPSNFYYASRSRPEPCCVLVLSGILQYLMNCTKISSMDSFKYCSSLLQEPFSSFNIVKRLTGLDLRFVLLCKFITS